MAELFRQDEENKKEFRRLIREKVVREKQVIKDRIDQEIPSWAAWALKPLAGLAFDMERAREEKRGDQEETSVKLAHGQEEGRDLGPEDHQIR